MKPMTPNPLGKRSTQQREVIHRVILEADGPLTVDEILERARREIEGLGVATVYRTIKLLSEGHQIHALVLADGQSRYEAADLGHHHHFRCRVCDRVYDLDICPVHIDENSGLPKGFVVEEHELTLYGTCPSCNPK